MSVMVAQRSLDLLRLRVEVIVHHDKIAIAAVTQVLDASAQRPLARRDLDLDRKSTRLNSSHLTQSRMPSSA